MQITVETRNAIDVRTAMLVLLVPKLEGGQWRPSPRAAAVDRALGGRIAAVIASGDFRGKMGEGLLLYPNAEIPAERVQLLGLGEEGELDAESLRCLAGHAVDAARNRRAASIAICAPRVRGLRLPQITQALAEGLVLASYRFDTYRERDKDAAPSVKRASLLIDRPAALKAARDACRTGVVLAESQNLSRQLSNEPANALPPAQLANAAKRVAREVGLGARVMDVAELKKHRMGGILAVGGGSANTPRLIVLDHDPRSKRGKKGAKRSAESARRLPTVCLVGKGITFDSGGISIKPSAAMDEMKHDMSGAAAVIGALRACALLKLPIRVVGVIAAAENMPSSTAYRPGDVVTTMSGKTVEILNTDAEGRVVLADALHYANTKFKPEAIVDLATLTGACVVALGKWATGLFGSHEGLIEAVRTAGESTAERAWPMPLWEVHRKAVRSDVADIKNTTGRDASSSTAAAFLANFVGDTPWVHLDIAGTAWGNKPSPYLKKGATGVGVRLLVELLQGWKEKQIV
ncbi:MAG: leucyl aminopeptidase [Myxococcales bacterium]|nr:leucyl aminopeptidase [Myxococcales bacterium]